MLSLGVMRCARFLVLVLLVMLALLLLVVHLLRVAFMLVHVLVVLLWVAATWFSVILVVDNLHDFSACLWIVINASRMLRTIHISTMRMVLLRVGCHLTIGVLSD